MCLQGNRAKQLPENTEESEDCLYINVYTPVVSNRKDVLKNKTV